MTKELEPIPFVGYVDLGEDTPQIEIAKSMRSEEHTSELQSH